MAKRKYIVTGHVTISMHVEVEASTPDEARRIARNAPVISLCNQCANGEAGHWNTSGEIDGEITIPRDGVQEDDHG